MTANQSNIDGLLLPPLATPVPAGPRPWISVFIPTYNTSRFLEQALRSVLDHRWPIDKLEIAVVDDCSPEGSPEPIVRSVGDGRVSFYRNVQNLGISGNVNRCIDLARGHWVHVLHSDDFVHPGFYEKLEQIVTRHQPKVVSFRSRTVDESGTQLALSHDLSDGEFPSAFRPSFLNGTPVECSGIVVKREVYEQVGGYLPHFKYVLDIEMWTRIFFNFPSAYCGEPLVSYRWHPSSAGARMRKAATDCPEFYEFIPYLKKNMRLTPAEERVYMKRAHRFVQDACREMARNNQWRDWMSLEKLYARHLDHPRDVIDFLLRLHRNFGSYLRQKFRS